MEEVLVVSCPASRNLEMEGRCQRKAQYDIVNQILTSESLQNEVASNWGSRVKRRGRTAYDVFVRQPLALRHVLSHIGADEECQQITALQILAPDALQVFLRSLLENRRLPVFDQLGSDALKRLRRILECSPTLGALMRKINQMTVRPPHELLTMRLRTGNQSRRTGPSDEIDGVPINNFLNAMLSSLGVPSGFKALKLYPKPTEVY